MRGGTCTDRHRCAFTPQIDVIATVDLHRSASRGTRVAVNAAVKLLVDSQAHRLVLRNNLDDDRVGRRSAYNGEPPTAEFG
jgi:hypothetical protein